MALHHMARPSKFFLAGAAWYEPPLLPVLRGNVFLKAAWVITNW